MRTHKWKNIFYILGVFIFSAVPQLIVYPKGYYYESDLPASIKYPLNAGSIIGICLLGYLYFRLNKSSIIHYIWLAFYFICTLIIASFYTYKYVHGSFNEQMYLSVMALFNVVASPVPFTIAALCLYVDKSFKQGSDETRSRSVTNENK